MGYLWWAISHKQELGSHSWVLQGTFSTLWLGQGRVGHDDCWGMSQCFSCWSAQGLLFQQQPCILPNPFWGQGCLAPIIRFNKQCLYALQWQSDSLNLAKRATWRSKRLHAHILYWALLTYISLFITRKKGGNTTLPHYGHCWVWSYPS